MRLKRHDHCFQPTEYSSKNYPMRYELNDIYLVTEDSAILFTINLSGCYNSFHPYPALSIAAYGYATSTCSSKSGPGLSSSTVPYSVRRSAW